VSFAFNVAWFSLPSHRRSQFLLVRNSGGDPLRYPLLFLLTDCSPSLCAQSFVYFHLSLHHIYMHSSFSPRLDCYHDGLFHPEFVSSSLRLSLSLSLVTRGHRFSLFLSCPYCLFKSIVFGLSRSVSVYRFGFFTRTSLHPDQVRSARFFPPFIRIISFRFHASSCPCTSILFCSRTFHHSFFTNSPLTQFLFALAWYNIPFVSLLFHDLPFALYPAGCRVEIVASDINGKMWSLDYRAACTDREREQGHM